MVTPTPPTNKLCRGCTRVLPLAMFARDRSRRDGRGSRCRECRSAWWQRHYDRNRTAEIARVARWRSDNPSKRAKLDRARRARERNGPGYRYAQWVDLCLRFDLRCVCCGRQVEDYRQLQPDHVRPLARGGRNTIRNLQPLCPRCNQQKGDCERDYRRGWIGWRRWPIYPTRDEGDGLE